MSDYKYKETWRWGVGGLVLTRPGQALSREAYGIPEGRSVVRLVSSSDSMTFHLDDGSVVEVVNLTDTCQKEIA